MINVMKVAEDSPYSGTTQNVYNSYTEIIDRIIEKIEVYWKCKGCAAAFPDCSKVCERKKVLDDLNLLKTKEK